MKKFTSPILLATTVILTGCGNGENVGTDPAPVADTSIVGAWDFNDGTEYGMLIFYANGFYIHWQDGSVDPNCGNPAGVEYGTYTFDGTLLNPTPVVDANECGLTDFSADVNITVNTTQLIFPDDRFLTRVDGGSGSLVGAWNTASTTKPFGLVFNNNGRYILWTANPDCAPGVEYGTYSFDGSNFNYNIVLDENGNCGLVANSTGSVPNVTVNGDIWSYDGDNIPRVKP